MKINPVLRNESKLSVRTWKFPLMIFVYTGLLAAGGIFLYNSLLKESYYNGLSLSTPIRIYMILSVAQSALLMFIVPSMSSTAITSEKEKQTLEVLLSTKMSSLSIVLGKLISSVSKVILLIFLSLPVYAITFLIGGVNIKNLFELSIFFIVTTFFIASIGIFFSTVLKNSKASTAATYGTVLLIVIGVVILAAVIYMSKVRATQDTTIIQFPSFAVFSPLTGFISLLFGQLGLSNLMFGPFSATVFLTTMNNFSNMIYISMALQVVITVILVLLSSYFLNPLNKKKFKIRKSE